MRTDNEFEFLKLSRADIRQLALCVKRGYLPYDVEPSQVLLDKFLIVDGWAETGPIYTPTNDGINYLAFLARKRRDSRRFCNHEKLLPFLFQRVLTHLGPSCLGSPLRGPRSVVLVKMRRDPKTSYSVFPGSVFSWMILSVVRLMCCGRACLGVTERTARGGVCCGRRFCLAVPSGHFAG